MTNYIYRRQCAWIIDLLPSDTYCDNFCVLRYLLRQFLCLAQVLHHPPPTPLCKWIYFRQDGNLEATFPSYQTSKLALCIFISHTLSLDFPLNWSIFLDRCFTRAWPLLWPILTTTLLFVFAVSHMWPGVSLRIRGWSSSTARFQPLTIQRVRCCYIK